jgi:class 3 adenylate cyclase
VPLPSLSGHWASMAGGTLRSVLVDIAVRAPTLMGGCLGRDHRRLATIVSLDVAGYSHLMGVDDNGTLTALKAHRRELIDPTIAEHERHDANSVAI